MASVLFCLTTLTAARAQEYGSHAYGYMGFNGAGSDFNESLTFGVGGDAVLYHGLGLGGDIGYLFPRSAFRSGVGVLTIGPLYSFRDRYFGGKLVPFVAGGYAAVFRDSGSNLFQYGGGVTYWFNDSLGVRADLRDYRFTESARSHFVSFRLGIAFR